MWSESFFVYFRLFKVSTQNKPFLTTLPYYGPGKMANFSTFQRRFIFLILSVFLSTFLHRTTLMILNGSRFLYVFGVLRLSLSRDHL